MKNKEIAWYSIVGYLLAVFGYFINDTNPTDGFSLFLIYLGLVSWCVFGIWGWVRLIKNN